MGNTPSKAKNQPDTRGRTNPAAPPIMDVQLEKLTEQIGAYSFTDEEKKDGIFEKIDWEKDVKEIDTYTKAREAKVKNFLEVYHHQYELQNLQLKNTGNPRFFRELFVKFIHDFNKKDYNYIKTKKLALRTTHPQKAAIKIEKLFGKFGAKLYQLALEEEANSNEYMNAVYNKSKQVVKSEEGDDKEWAERPVIIIAGPSASGKSFARDTVIKKVAPTLKNTGKKAEIPNQVVSVDGGVAREVSQMRKLAILAANNKGYPGIKDLHKQSKALKKIKDRIYKKAVEGTKHGIVVPETFSAYMKPDDGSKRMLEELCQLKNAKIVFTCVKGKKDKYFRKTVGAMGSSRAWKTAWKQGTAETSIEENISSNRQALDLNIDKTCESKAYGAAGFYPGVVGSRLAERWFAKHQSTSPRMTIINDRMPVKVAENGQWVFSDDGDANLVSMRAVDEYNEYVEKFDRSLTVADLSKLIPVEDFNKINSSSQDDSQLKKHIIDRNLELQRDEIKQKKENTQPLIEESAFDQYQSVIKQLKDAIVKLPELLDGKKNNPTKLALSQLCEELAGADLNNSNDVNIFLKKIVRFMQNKDLQLPPEVVTALQNIYDPLYSLNSIRRATSVDAPAASPLSTPLSELSRHILRDSPHDTSGRKTINKDAPVERLKNLTLGESSLDLDAEAKAQIRMLQRLDYDYEFKKDKSSKNQVFIKDLRQTRVEDLNPIHSQEARIQALRYLRGMLLIYENTPRNKTFDHREFLGAIKAAYQAYEEKIALLPAATVAFAQELLHTFQQIYASNFKIKDVKKACKPISMAKDLAILLEGPPPDVCTISANKGQITIERASIAKVSQEYYVDTFIVNQSRWLPNAVKLAGFDNPSDPNNWLQHFVDNNVDALSKAGMPAPPSARWLPLPANNQHIETFVGGVDKKGQLIHGYSTHFIRMGATSAYEIADREAMDDFSKKQLKELFKNNLYAAIAAYEKKHLALGKKGAFDFHFNYQTLLTPHRGERFAPHTDNNDRFVNAAKEAMWELAAEAQTNSMLRHVNLHFYQTNAPINNVSSWVSATSIDSDHDQRKEKLERIDAYLKDIDLTNLNKNDPALADEVATRRKAVDVLRAILNKQRPFGKLAPYQRNVMIAALEFLMEGSQALTLAGCKSARDRTAVFAAAVKTMQENSQAMYEWETLNAGIIHSLKQGQHFRAMMHHCAIAKVKAVHKDFMTQLPRQMQEDIEEHKAFTKSMRPLEKERLKEISKLNAIVAEKKLKAKVDSKSEVKAEKVLGHDLPSESPRIERKLIVDPMNSPLKEATKPAEKEKGKNANDKYYVPLEEISDDNTEFGAKKTPLVRGMQNSNEPKVGPKPITFTPPSRSANATVPTKSTLEQTRQPTRTPDSSPSLSENEAYQPRPANHDMAPTNQTASSTTRAADTMQAHLEAIKKFAAYAKSSVAVMNAATGPAADARRAQMVHDCEQSLKRLEDYYDQTRENPGIRKELEILESDLNDTLGLLRQPQQAPDAQPGIVHFFAEAKIVENNTEAIKECIEEIMSRDQINTDDDPATISVHQSEGKPILATPRNQNGRTTDFTDKANNLARVTHKVINTHSSTTAPQQSSAREGTHVISVQHYVREVFTSECHIKPTAPLEKTTVKKGWFFKPAVKLPHDDILVAGRLFIENHLRSDPKISFGANGEWVGPDIRLAGNFSKDLLESIMLHLIVNKHQDHVVLSKALSHLLGQYKPTPAQIKEYRQRMLTLYKDTPVLAYDRESARELTKAATRPATNEPAPTRRNSYTSS